MKQRSVVDSLTVSLAELRATKAKLDMVIEDIELSLQEALLADLKARSANADATPKTLEANISPKLVFDAARGASSSKVGRDGGFV